ncbi:MAG: undecaprenyl-diphosphate phosphatase [Candidatus Deferrimicrobium sp.]
MTILNILILAVVQGAAELLPVSSSAHVIVAAKLMGLDPVRPEMTLLLVMLHTGTMFAVITYFWSAWKANYARSRETLGEIVLRVTVATGFTGAVGMILKYLIERFTLGNRPHPEVELLFGNLVLIGSALAAAGVLIIYSGIRGTAREGTTGPSIRQSSLIGAVQGLCLPFRGFSRSGATISTGLLLGLPRRVAEEFSFALAVVLTPPVIVREAHRLLAAQEAIPAGAVELARLFYPGAAGMVFSFLSGLLALRWLSRWLEEGRWPLFGIYCLFASGIVFLLHLKGY